MIYKYFQPDHGADGADRAAAVLVAAAAGEREHDADQPQRVRAAAGPRLGVPQGPAPHRGHAGGGQYHWIGVVSTS